MLQCLKILKRLSKLCNYEDVKKSIKLNLKVKKNYQSNDYLGMLYLFRVTCPMPTISTINWIK